MLAMLLPLGLCADPITITVLGQTAQTNTETLAAGTLCMMSGTFSSTCQSGVVDSGTSFGISNASVAGVANEVPQYPLPGLGLTVSASTEADYLPAAAAASASASLQESIVITGGVGTGYLDIGFGYSQGFGFSSYTTRNASINGTTLNGPGLNGSTLPGPAFFVVPFEFGQALEFGLSVSAYADNQSGGSSLQSFVAGMRIYSHMPTGCGENDEPCSDPNFTPVEIPTLITTPEPSTALLAGLGLFAAAPCRRRFFRPTNL